MSFLKKNLLVPAAAYAALYLLTSVFLSPQVLQYLDLRKSQLTLIFLCVALYEIGNAVKVYLFVRALTDSEEDQAKWTDEVTALAGGWSIEVAIFEQLRQLSTDI